VTNSKKRFVQSIGDVARSTSPAASVKSRLADAVEKQDRASIRTLLNNRRRERAAGRWMTALHWAVYSTISKPRNSSPTLVRT